MGVTQRRYRLLADFATVHSFLTDTYSIDTLNSHLFSSSLSMPTRIRRLITNSHASVRTLGE